MPRSRIDDLLMVHHFWLSDISPSIQFPFFAFNPVLGFQSVSAPEIVVEVDEFTEGNSPWRRKAAGKADVGTVTLSRGTRFWDADFYRWIDQTIRGYGKPRRDLLLIQMMSAGPSASGTPSVPVGPFEFTSRFPARAWVLRRSIPVRYRTAGDFNAESNEVSVMELDIAAEQVEEISLGGVV